MRYLSIGELARRTGIRPSALRYYEEAGVLDAPVRVSGRRQYDPEAVQRVALLRSAQQAGFTLAEVKTLFHGFGPETPLSNRWRSLAGGKAGELDRLDQRIRGMRHMLELDLACDCVRVEDCSLAASSGSAGTEARDKS